MADPKKGTGKKPKGSGRRLYTDENPKDTVGIKFQNHLLEKYKYLLFWSKERRWLESQNKRV